MPLGSPGLQGQIVRLQPLGAAARGVTLLVDGQPVMASAGDSVLVAVLAAGHRVRRSEFTGEFRAGFCLMGACQDCWMWTVEGFRIQACTTPAADGMGLLTQPPPDWVGCADGDA